MWEKNQSEDKYYIEVGYDINCFKSFEEAIIIVVVILLLTLAEIPIKWKENIDC